MKFKEVLTEAEGSTRTYYGFISGGRAGNRYNHGEIEIPLDITELEQQIEDGDIIDLTPNDGNLQKVVDAAANNELFVDWDVFGEGIIGIGPDPTELELAIRRHMSGDEDNRSDGRTMNYSPSSWSQ